MTDEEKRGETNRIETQKAPLRPDLRLENLVRFLARRAAERDYAEMVKQSRRTPPPDGGGGRIR